MAYDEVSIDSVRSALKRRNWAIILKRNDTEQYLPVYVGASQANIVKRELMGIRPVEAEEYERFLAGENIARFNLKSVVVERSQDGDFYARLLLTENGNPIEMNCTFAAGLALGFRKRARILVDETTFQEAGFSLSY